MDEYDFSLYNCTFDLAKCGCENCEESRMRILTDILLGRE